MSLLGCLVIPIHSLGVILADAIAFVIAIPKVVLRFGKILLGSILKEFDGFVGILADSLAL